MSVIAVRKQPNLSNIQKSVLNWSVPKIDPEEETQVQNPNIEDRFPVFINSKGFAFDKYYNLIDVDQKENRNEQEQEQEQEQERYKQNQNQNQNNKMEPKINKDKKNKFQTLLQDNYLKEKSKTERPNLYRKKHSPNNIFQLKPFPQVDKFDKFEDFEKAVLDWESQTKSQIGYLQLPQTISRVYYRPSIRKSEVDQYSNFSHRNSLASTGENRSSRKKSESGSSVSIGSISGESFNNTGLNKRRKTGDSENAQLLEYGVMDGTSCIISSEQDQWNNQLISQEPDPMYYDTFEDYRLAYKNWSKNVIGELKIIPPHARDFEHLEHFLTFKKKDKIQKKREERRNNLIFKNKISDQKKEKNIIEETYFDDFFKKIYNFNNLFSNVTDNQYLNKDKKPSKTNKSDDNNQEKNAKTKFIDLDQKTQKLLVAFSKKVDFNIKKNQTFYSVPSPKIYGLIHGTFKQTKNSKRAKKTTKKKKNKKNNNKTKKVSNTDNTSNKNNNNSVTRKRIKKKQKSREPVRVTTENLGNLCLFGLDPIMDKPSNNYSCPTTINGKRVYFDIPQYDCFQATNLKALADTPEYIQQIKKKIFQIAQIAENQQLNSWYYPNKTPKKNFLNLKKSVNKLIKKNNFTIKKMIKIKKKKIKKDIKEILCVKNNFMDGLLLMNKSKFTNTRYISIIILKKILNNKQWLNSVSMYFQNNIKNQTLINNILPEVEYYKTKNHHHHHHHHHNNNNNTKRHINLNKTSILLISGLFTKFVLGYIKQIQYPKLFVNSFINASFCNSLFSRIQYYLKEDINNEALVSSTKLLLKIYKLFLKFNLFQLQSSSNQSGDNSGNSSTNDESDTNKKNNKKKKNDDNKVIRLNNKMKKIEKVIINQEFIEKIYSLISANPNKYPKTKKNLFKLYIVLFKKHSIYQLNFKDDTFFGKIVQIARSSSNEKLNKQIWILLYQLILKNKEILGILKKKYLKIIMELINTNNHDTIISYGLDWISKIFVMDQVEKQRMSLKLKPLRNTKKPLKSMEKDIKAFTDFFLDNSLFVKINMLYMKYKENYNGIVFINLAKLYQTIIFSGNCIKIKKKNIKKEYGIGIIKMEELLTGFTNDNNKQKNNKKSISPSVQKNKSDKINYRHTINMKRKSKIFGKF
ncbi:sca1 complex scaffold protein scaa [Anaeramoeba flamelloides]|uniref:Sca1 complex scaffold protein scaa n=1 Tax=Anaeramoeba flamelloides TaxID=1746091 RepID=A0ABQ8XPB0_9EUKA|nr:sca1 complex scaffold protein scaa [Anaeramoeba flamelloides]